MGWERMGGKGYRMERERGGLEEGMGCGERWREREMGGDEWEREGRV